MDLSPMRDLSTDRTLLHNSRFDIGLFDFKLVELNGVAIEDVLLVEARILFAS
jgi:hypothetical protein